MTRNELRALVAAPIYTLLRHTREDGLVALRRDALEEADELLQEARGEPEDPEADEAPAVARGDPFFVIHRETAKAISSSSGEWPVIPENLARGADLVVGKAIECIDSAIFSGDTFTALTAIEYLEWHIGRWVREIKRKRDLLEAEPAPAPPPPAPRVICSICYQVGHDDTTCTENIPF